MVYSNKKQTKGVSQKVSNKKTNLRERKSNTVSRRLSKKRNAKKNKTVKTLRKKKGGARFPIEIYYSLPSVEKLKKLLEGLEYEEIIKHLQDMDYLIKGPELTFSTSLTDKKKEYEACINSYIKEYKINNKDELDMITKFFRDIEKIDFMKSALSQITIKEIEMIYNSYHEDIKEKQTIMKKYHDVRENELKDTKGLLEQALDLESKKRLNWKHVLGDEASITKEREKQAAEREIIEQALRQKEQEAAATRQTEEEEAAATRQTELKAAAAARQKDPKKYSLSVEERERIREIKKRIELKRAEEAKKAAEEAKKAAEKAARTKASGFRLSEEELEKVLKRGNELEEARKLKIAKEAEDRAAAASAVKPIDPRIKQDQDKIRIRRLLLLLMGEKGYLKVKPVLNILLQHVNSEDINSLTVLESNVPISTFKGDDKQKQELFTIKDVLSRWISHVLEKEDSQEYTEEDKKTYLELENELNKLLILNLGDINSIIKHINDQLKENRKNSLRPHLEVYLKENNFTEEVQDGIRKLLEYYYFPKLPGVPPTKIEEIAKLMIKERLGSSIDIDTIINKSEVLISKLNSISGVEDENLKKLRKIKDLLESWEQKQYQQQQLQQQRGGAVSCTSEQKNNCFLIKSLYGRTFDHFSLYLENTNSLSVYKNNTNKVKEITNKVKEINLEDINFMLPVKIEYPETDIDPDKIFGDILKSKPSHLFVINSSLDGKDVSEYFIMSQTMSPFLEEFLKEKNRSFVNRITQNDDNQKLIYKGEVPVKIGLVLDRIKQSRENFESPEIFKGSESSHPMENPAFRKRKPSQEGSSSHRSLKKSRRSRKLSKKRPSRHH